MSSQFFEEIESKLNVEFPDFIKNIFLLNGLDNKVSFRKLTEGDLTELETFVQTELELLLPSNDVNTNLEKYYGPFATNKSKFKFLMGHKKLIMAAKELLDDEEKSSGNREASSEGNRDSQTSSGTKGKAKRTEMTKQSKVLGKVQENSGEQTPLVELATNLHEELKIVKKRVVTWINSVLNKSAINNDFLKCCLDQTEPKENSCKQEIGGYLSCEIPCPLCNSDIKVKQLEKNGNYHWILSNFFTHFQKHDLKQFCKEKNPLNISLTNSQRSILQYCHPAEDSASRTTSSALIESSTKTPGLIGTSTETSTKGDDHPTTIDVSSDTSEDEFPPRVQPTGKKRPLLEHSDEEDTDLASVQKSLHNTVDKPNIILPDVENTDCSTAFSEGEGSVGVSAHSENESISSETPRNFIQLQNSFGSPSKSPLNEPPSKKAASKNSRPVRSQRKRQKIKSQPLITNFFHQITQIEKVLHENEQLKSMLIRQTTSFYPLKSSSEIDAQEATVKVSHFLKCLMQTTQANKNMSKNANRFEGDLKQFCLYLLLIGGRLLYETLSANLPRGIPSITTLIRCINFINIEEGQLRMQDLSTFLSSRNLPRVVWISEDATKITGRIQYNSKNNQLVGFVLPHTNGLPIKKSFEATSVQDMQTYFTEESRADYAYLVMAQPLIDQTPAFCLLIFGTNNRFTNEDVSSRWKRIQSEAAKEGITILGHSSDGDTRCLKSMRLLSLLNQQTENPTWEWFQMDLDDGLLCIQDTVHIGTKLRTRLLKPGIVLPIGNHFVDVKHVEELISKVTKEKHFLTAADLRGEDKMNFRSVQKLANSDVSRLLSEHVENSSGTCVYLKIIRYVLRSFLEKDLSVSERIRSIWYVVFFLRIWRSWLQNSEFSITSNFVSLNTYMCLELNAHGMLKLVRKYRDNKDLQELPEFATWLFSSQPCEQAFRATRSMTSTFSTVVNFNMFEIINRMNKIETIINSVNDLSENFVFPREIERHQPPRAKPPTTEFPDDASIEMICMEALEEAKNDLGQLGVHVENLEKTAWTNIQSTDKIVVYNENNAESDEEDFVIEDLAGETNSSTATALARAEEIIELESLDDSEKRLEEDERMTLNIDIEDLNLPDYDKDIAEDPSSPFVKVKIGNNIKTVRKTTLCWFLDERQNRVSSDRLSRFKVTRKQSSSNRSEKIFPIRGTTAQDNSLDSITIGVTIELDMYYAVYYSDNWYIGRILEINERNGEMEYKVKFLKSSSFNYVWPKREDIQMVDKQYIFFGPIAMGDARGDLGSMSIAKSDKEKIQTLYNSLKKQQM